MHISVIGTGYLGAAHAACLAATGHTVVGVDTDPARTEALAAGRAPFHEPGLDDLLHAAVTRGDLTFTCDVGAAADAEVHFLCVGTPQGPDGAADLGALHDAVAALAPVLRPDCLVVGKSTVPVGTAAQLAVWLRQHVRGGARLAWNPEFLREGHAVEDSLRPDRLVLGVEDDESDLRLRDVYREAVLAGVPVVRTDLATAELAKVSANVMLAARVSLVNVLAEVCERAGADVADLTRVLGLDTRIGDEFLAPGLGYGGGCLPKDTRAFIARASELGLTGTVQVLREVDAVNLHQRRRTVAWAGRLLDGRLAGRRVAALGAAFKAGSDDVRDSPALAVVRELVAGGADVRVHDPRAAGAVARAVPGAVGTDDVATAFADADLVLVLTPWEEYAALDPVALAELVRTPQVLDARLVVDRDKWAAAGWQVHALGRGD